MIARNQLVPTKKYYDLFFEKARACLEVYKKLAKSSGGDPDISLDELLVGMARSMSSTKYFSGTASLKEFIISQGDFIYKQLIGFDTMLKANDKGFEDIPALIALRDERKKQAHFANTRVRPSNATLRIGSRIADKKKRIAKAKSEAADYQKLLASRLKEQRDRRSESLAKKRSRLSTATKPTATA
ncbi:hypothetical protein RYX36_032624 [Vicia faba]